MPTAEDRIRTYFQEELKLTLFRKHVVEDLINSHRSQREIVGENTSRELRAHRRMRWLPWPVRRWFLGY